MIIIAIALVLIIPITVFVLLPMDESIENNSNEDIIIGKSISEEQVEFNQPEK